MRRAAVIAVMLGVAVSASACRRIDRGAADAARQQVPRARSHAEAVEVLEEWSGLLEAATGRAAAKDYAAAMRKIEAAMKLVERFGIREEGATYFEAYRLLARVPAAEGDRLLIVLLQDDQLVKTKELVIDRAVEHLHLDEQARKDLAALPVPRQVEVLIPLLRSRAVTPTPGAGGLAGDDGGRR